MPLQPTARLRIDTSLGPISGSGSSSAAFTSARTSASTPGTSTQLRSAKSVQRLRTASSTSTSSTTSNPSHALDRASAAVASTSIPTSHTGLHAQSNSISVSSGSESEDDPDAFTYVLAMHDYYPPSSSTPSAMNASTCLSFRAGQVIRLYNRDPSGWWDGEVDGRRGWFPSNYVTADMDMLKDEELPGMLRSSSQTGHSHNMSTSSAASWTSSSSIKPIPSSFNRADHRPTLSTSTLSSTTSTSTTSSDAYCPPIMVPLLHAVSLLSNVVRERRFAHLQPATACIISCVRSILTEVACLQRDAPILKRYAVLARERKRILADLGALVETAKTASGGGQQEVSEPQREDEADGMLKLAGQLFTHIRGFLAVAIQCGVVVQPPSRMQANSEGSEVEGKGSIQGRWDSQEGTLVRSDEEYEDWEIKNKGIANGTTNGIEERLRTKRERETTVTPSGHLRAKSLSDLRNRPNADEDPPAIPVTDGGGNTPGKMQSLGIAAGKQWAAQQATANNSLYAKRFVSAPATHPHTHHKSAQSSVSSVASASSSLSSSSGSSSSSSAHATSTTPSFTFPTGPSSSPILLAALRHTHDTYLSTIAAFIGHAHSHSRTSHASSTGHMYDLVREVVEVVCKLLTIVDAVLKCEDVSPTKKPDLRRAKEGLYEVTSVLADAVRKLTTTAGAEGMGLEGEDSEEEEKAALLRCATNALKAGADCVGAVKKCLQRPASERPFVIVLPDPDGVDGANADGAYAYTPSKFSAQHQHSRSQTYSTTPQTPNTGHVRSRSALQELYRVNGVADGEDEDLTIQAETVSFNIDETPRRPEPSVPEEREPAAESESEADVPLVQTEALSDTEDEHDAWSPEPDKDKPLPPLQISTPLELGSRPPSPISSASIAPTDDGTTWEGGHSTQSHQSPQFLQNKLHNGELPLPPVPEAALPDLPHSQPNPLSWLLSHDHPVEDVAYNSEGQLVGGTLQALVERMTPHDVLVEPAFAAVFFLTFRQFTTPAELVETLITRYNIVPPAGLTDGEIYLWQQQKGLPVRLRVSNFVKSWLENNWRPDVDNVVLPELLAFTRDALALMFPIPSQRILDLIQLRTMAQETGVSTRSDRPRDAGIPLNPPLSMIQPSEVPRPIMTKAVLSALRTKNYAAISVTDFDALELARQLTTMECTLYCAIQSEELLETGQSGGAYPSNVKAVTSLSTVITGWVAESILNEPDTKKRTGLVKFYIKVADRCISLQNFSTPRSILAALDSSTISRLHQTWTGLPQKNKLQMETLRKLADHARNYHEYRTRLRNTAPPAVPFLGLYLTDVTFCREGNPSHRSSPKNPEKKLLNFNKYHKLARIVQDMSRFQVPYNLKQIPEVQDYLRDAFEQSKNRTDLQDLYRRSLLVEPRRPADTPPSGDVRQLFQWATRSQATAASAS